MRIFPIPGPGARAGFTMVEMLISMVIMSILLAIGVPRMSQMRDRGAVRSAKQQVAAYLATARAAAIRRGRPAQFRADGNRIWVTTTGVNVTDTVAKPMRLDHEYSVALAAGVGAVVFDARGFVTNLTASQKFKVTRSTYADSVCISRAGMIMQRCGL